MLSLLSISFVCGLFASWSRASLKRKQHQTETNDLQEQPMQRGLIWYRSREQGGACLLRLNV
jgi:hypothetical protein